MTDGPTAPPHIDEVTGRRFCVAGFGTAGYACTDALLQAGAARVVAVDSRDTAPLVERRRVLTELGADVRLGVVTEAWPDDAGGPAEFDALVVSPGWHPDAPLIVEAERRGLPVWSEIELAWRLRPLRTPPGREPAPWLCVTGTNGKTTTVQMLAAMMVADGKRCVAAGNVGLPLLAAVLDPDPFDVLAVELSSYQLAFTESMSPYAAALLNIAEDHLDWHHTMEEYVAAKAKIYHRCQVACVYNAADPVTEQAVRDAEVVEGCRAIGFTLGIPGPSMVGVVEDLIVDRAFIAQRISAAQELASTTQVHPPAPHNVENALAAAALARSFGVQPASIGRALDGFTPDAHRIAEVRADAGTGVTWIDDSKATNPHAAAASLSAFDPVVWIAGGDAKGASFDDLVERAAGRLRGVVLLGRDRAVIAAALARHAPDVPVIEVDGTDHEVMRRVVDHAAGLARPGDTVLLAPGCASWDMFTDYGARGDAFADAVRRLGIEN